MFVHISFSPSSSQTEEVVVDEPRGRDQSVPFTLIRERGTYGTVTVNFEVRDQTNTQTGDVLLIIHSN